MVANYVKTSFRKFRRQKTHTLINVVGLTLGLLCAILIFQKLTYELSFDTHHPDVDHIYRIVHSDTEFGETEYHSGVPYPLFDAFRQDFPEVEEVVIVDRNFFDPVIAIRRADGTIERFKEEEDYGLVNQDYLDTFHQVWLHGDPATAMVEPRTAVISETLAQKYFGETDVVGEVLTQDEIDYTITGVVEDAPTNTYNSLNLMLSFNVGEEHERGNDNWGSVSSAVQCFVKLPSNIQASAIDRRFRDFILKHHGEEAAQEKEFFLQPITELHFDTRFGAGHGTLMSYETIWALGLIGVFLLLTACINFINLNTVLVFKRSKEVGVRKTLGGTSRQIMAYFMTETALTTLMALGLALLLVNPVMALARPFIGENLSANPFTDPALLGFGIVVAVALTLLSGLYPSFLLARLHPTTAIRGQVDFKPGTFFSLRRGLVVVQFAITQVLIICTLAAMLQIRHLYEVPLGYDTEALVEFAVPDQEDQTKLQTFKQRLLQSAAVSNVTFSNSGATSGSTWASNFHYYKDDEQLENNTQVKVVDIDYVKTYGMTLVAGEDFIPTDSVTGFIVNESLVQLMGYTSPDDALGTPIDTWSYEKIPVVGVIRDFNTNSLHDPIEATLLMPTTRFPFVGAMRVNMSNLDEALATLETAFETTYPNDFLDYSFLDENIAEFYEREQAMQLLIQAFALVAILIGCIGLFGLISYAVSQRSKEVGIRKVLGASVSHIVGLFTREFVLLVVIGFFLSAPIAYYAMNLWLEEFAYRITLGPFLFAVALVISLTLALLTVGYKTYRAAVSNPVEAIRQE